MPDPSRVDRKIRQVEKMLPDDDADGGDGPRFSVVLPDRKPDPPRRFQSEEALRTHFGGRPGHPVVIFPPPSEAPSPDHA